MKVAVFSDIHGNIHALKAILNDLKLQDMDKIIFLGDAISIGPKPNECLDLLLQDDIIFLLGNHERYLTEGLKHFDLTDAEIRHQRWTQSQISNHNKELLKQKSLKYHLNVNNIKVEFTHFPFNNETNDFYKAQTFTEKNVHNVFDHTQSLYVFGHHHKSQDLNVSHQRFLNVGSSGCCNTDETHYTILTLQEDISVETVTLKYDFDKLKEDVLASSNPENKFLAKIFFGINL